MPECALILGGLQEAWRPYLLAVHAMLQGLSLKLGLSLLQQVLMVLGNVPSQLLLSLCLLCSGLPLLLRMLLPTACHCQAMISQPRLEQAWQNARNLKMDGVSTAVCWCLLCLCW